MTDLNDRAVATGDVGDPRKGARPMNGAAAKKAQGAISIRQAPFQRGDHVEIAARLVGSLRAKAETTFTDGKVYQYDPARGVFSVVPPAVLSRTVQAFAGVAIHADGKKPKTLQIKASDVAGSIKLAADQLTDPDFFDGPRRGVVFSDCFVEVTAEQIVRRAHNPEHRARFAYPFAFVDRAHPTLLLEFFAQVFRDDTDRESKIQLLQEYLGVSMLGLATKFQQALVQVGDGGNGKGVLTSVFERCMPPGSVCAIPPQDAGQEYRRAMLAGKLLNIVSELPEADILDSESWKSIVAGDTTTGREIRKEPFTFKPVAGHIYSANRLPGTTDQTHGFWRRIVVVSFNRIFERHEQDPGLADRIVETEAPAIVSWALAGAQRALLVGRYTAPESSEKAVDTWKRSADQVRAFVDDWCARLPLDADVSAGVPAERLYRSFRQWAVENGHKPVASNKFGERMRLLGLPSQHAATARFYAVSLTRNGWDEEGSQ